MSWGVGLWLRAGKTDAGLTCGWRQLTCIYPRAMDDGAEEGSRWSFGHVPLRREMPFFLAARGLGVEVAHYSGFTPRSTRVTRRMRSPLQPPWARRGGCPFTTPPRFPRIAALTMNPLPTAPMP